MKRLVLILIVLFSLCSLFAVSDARLKEIAMELNVPMSAIKNLVNVYNPDNQNINNSVIRVSFDEYMFDYNTNMVEADRKYKGKELEIYNCYGRDISQAFYNKNCDYFISSSIMYKSILLYINKADNALIPEVIDNYFTVRGKQGIMYDILDNCRIIQIGYTE